MSGVDSLFSPSALARAMDSEACCLPMRLCFCWVFAAAQISGTWRAALTMRLPLQRPQPTHWPASWYVGVPASCVFPGLEMLRTYRGNQCNIQNPNSKGGTKDHRNLRISLSRLVSLSSVPQTWTFSRLLSGISSAWRVERSTVSALRVLLPWSAIPAVARGCTVITISAQVLEVTRPVRHSLLSAATSKPFFEKRVARSNYHARSIARTPRMPQNVPQLSESE